MMLYFASKYRRERGAQPKRLESTGLSRLVTALAVTRDMNEAAAPGVTWIVTTKIDGSHVPAVVGRGSGAAVLIAAGVYNIERAEELGPQQAA